MTDGSVKSDGSHVLAYCKDCGAMTTPEDGYWMPCACGGLQLLVPEFAARMTWQPKLTESDRRLLRVLAVGAS